MQKSSRIGGLAVRKAEKNTTVPLVSGTNGTVMCNSLAGRGLGGVCFLDDHCGMVAERIFHVWVAWARRGYENSCRIRQSGKPIGRYW